MRDAALEDTLDPRQEVGDFRTRFGHLPRSCRDWGRRNVTASSVITQQHQEGNETFPSDVQTQGNEFVLPYFERHFDIRVSVYFMRHAKYQCGYLSN